jgi:hypothetical protein
MPASSWVVLPAEVSRVISCIFYDVLYMPASSWVVLPAEVSRVISCIFYNQCVYEWNSYRQQWDGGDVTSFGLVPAASGATMFVVY